MRTHRNASLAINQIFIAVRPPQQQQPPRRTSIRPVGSGGGCGGGGGDIGPTDRLSSVVQLFNIRPPRRACLYRLLFVIEAPEPDTGDPWSGGPSAPNRDIFVQ